MKIIVVVLIVFGCSLGLRGQTIVETPDTIVCPADLVEQNAQYPGGEDSMLKFILRNIIYPTGLTLDHPVKVIIEFVVEKDGSVSNVKALNKTVGDGLEEECERVIKQLSKFTPAMQNNKPVRVRMRVPIKFK